MRPNGNFLLRATGLWAWGVLLMLTAMQTNPGAAKAAEPVVLVSSFTKGEAGGISAFRFHAESGELQPLHRNANIPHPFFFDVNDRHTHLYSIHTEVFSGREPNELAAYRLDISTGKLEPLNRQTTRGTASCFVELDQTGRAVLVANYTTGNVTSYRIESDGKLSSPVSFFQHAGSSVNEKRQAGPHAHCFVIAPNNRHAYAADLGLDQILCYTLAVESGELQPAAQPFVRTLPGAGPRHLTFHPDGRNMYVINELHNSVTHFSFDPETGFLVERATISTLPDDFDGVSHCADLKITPDGKYLYGTNRGHDSLAMYRIGAQGELDLIGIEPSLGKGPQNLAISANGRWLLCANMPGNNLIVFRIDSDTGQLQPHGEPLEVAMPSCIRILEPTNK